MANLFQTGGVAGSSASFTVSDAGVLTVTDSTGATIFTVSATGVVTPAAGLDVGSQNILASYIVKPVIAVGNATGGSTDAALTLQLNKLDGTAIDTARQVFVFGSSLQYAPFAPSSTLSFVTATAGSIIYAGSGYAVVKTNAAGAFACTARNTADETLYFMAVQAFGISVLADGCIVLPGLQDSAAWSA